MNGVRRFLGGVVTAPSYDPSTSPPLASAQLTNVPPWVKPSNGSKVSGLSIRKDRQPFAVPTEDGDLVVSSPSSRSVGSTSPFTSSGSQTSATTTSPSRSRANTDDSAKAGPSRLNSRKLPSTSGQEFHRSSGILNTRDELLMSLLASEAVVDSREFEILTAEQVEELKKEHDILSSRLTGLSKKLNLEIKIRDAAVSLSKVDASHKKSSKETDDQLEASNRKVETTQKELWSVSERANEVQKKLLEHRAGVLSMSVRSMEKKMAKSNGSAHDDDSGYNTPNQGVPLSPTGSSVTSTSSASKPRFEGAHFFAGHAGSVVPKRRTTMSAADITALEEKLKAATDALAAANVKTGQLARELSIIRLEKEQIETSMSMELQSAEDTIATLEKDVPRLKAMEQQLGELRNEKRLWDQDRAALVERVGEVESLERRLEEQTGDTSGMEGLRRDLDRLRSENEGALRALRTIVQAHGIVLFSSDTSLPSIVSSIASHLASLIARMEGHEMLRQEWENTRRRLEEDVRTGLDKREALYREIEEARREREDARRELRDAEARIKDQTLSLSPHRSPVPLSPSVTDSENDISRITSVLHPLWSILPSPEARAAKLSSRSNPNLRANSPNGPGSPKVSSLAELDVRSLKALYDNNKFAYPPSPNLAPFSIEGFAQRVQALIADDKALIERLIRFAQAHDLLKQNAERAQKLAQESGGSLETYQKQVRALEERNMSLSSKQIALQDEIHQLQEAVERIRTEKRDLETQATEQSETCRQLTQANNALSAKALRLAEEAAAAPIMMRKQLDECQANLKKAEGEIDSMRMSESDQRIALLDELNAMQTENGNLRAQLRALKK